MYTTYVTSPDKALAHLFLHCCFKDGEFNEAEIDEVSGKFAALGLQKDLNFKDELKDYLSYKNTSLQDESGYLDHLLKLINPTNELALYSYCVELCLSDAALEFSEKSFLNKLGSLLNIEESEQATIEKLMVQRGVVQSQKFF